MDAFPPSTETNFSSGQTGLKISPPFTFLMAVINICVLLRCYGGCLIAPPYITCFGAMFTDHANCYPRHSIIEPFRLSTNAIIGLLRELHTTF